MIDHYAGHDMLNMIHTNHNLSLVYNQQFSTTNSALWADYVTAELGPKGLPILFQKILPADLSESEIFHVNDKPVGYPFFVSEGGWFPHEIGLRFYNNLAQIQPNMVEVGRAVSFIALEKRNILELRLLSLAKAPLILRNIARVNARFTRNKTPKIVSLSKKSGKLRLTYLEGFSHNTQCTDYYRGFVEGTLNFLGFKDVKSEVLLDQTDCNAAGLTEILFCWEEKSFPARFTFKRSATKLSLRETELVQLLSEGITHKEICYLTDLSYETVKFHFTNARKKLDCRTREELVAKFVIARMRNR